jgi:16S rRNA C967 or C1407 C5-methylase (RsmB/RsmF family)
VKKIPFRDFHLLQILELSSCEKKPLDLLFNHYFRANKALGSKDKKEISETIYGIIRWLSLIDALIGPPHTWQRRLEGYRTLNLEERFKDPTLAAHIRASLPKELFEMLEKSLGMDRAIQVAHASNAQAPATVRINPLKTTREALFNRWKGIHDISKTAQSPFGIIFNRRINYFQLPEFKEGLFEVQDEASQLLANMVEAKPGDQVLDYCAGSGGKTLAFAHKLEGKGQIYLYDIRPYALLEAKKRLARAGIQNSQIPNKLNHLKGKMDWVLVDAPCSGSGTYRRNPDMKWRFNKEEFEKLLDLQKEIFKQALAYLKPGGQIVYGTCSILSCENDEQILHFLREFPLQLVGEPFRSLPTEGGMDGFFGACMMLQS